MKNTEPYTVTVRVWSRNGHTRILRLPPGKTVERTEGGATDEGYQYVEERYERLAGSPVIELEVSTESQDCDGRFSSLSGFRAYAVDVKARFSTGYGIWERIDYSQRDFAAEAMGY